jgi:acyl-CoA thioester hydrolase
MRHSAYNDYASQTRLLFMAEKGYGIEWFQKHNVFPVLFREETVFLKEIHGNETIRIDAVLLSMNEDGSRWSIMNCFYKENGTLAARLTVDGAWMDLVKRKLKVPPAELLDLFNSLGKGE